MRNVTGSYRLDPGSEAILGARRLQLLQRDDAVIGRYGRRGSVRGYVRDHHLKAIWREIGRSGELELLFCADFDTFAGSYRVGDREFKVSGRRAARS